MKRSIIPTLCWLACSLLLGWCGESRAGVVYQTGFESPAFTPGPLAGQDGWQVFGGGNTSNSVTIQSNFVESGNQAMEINAGLATGQTGGFRIDPSPVGDSIVQMKADVYLTSSSAETAWQFAGLTANGTFFGGFNVLTDGTLQVITNGFPNTGRVVTRDAWNTYEVDYDFTTQTFNILINQQVVLSNVAFLDKADVFGEGIIDTFNTPGGNDIGYVDNYSINAFSVPEPASLTLLGLGSLGLLGACRARGLRVGPA